MNQWTYILCFLNPRCTSVAKSVAFGDLNLGRPVPRKTKKRGATANRKFSAQLCSCKICIILHMHFWCTLDETSCISIYLSTVDPFNLVHSWVDRPCYKTTDTNRNLLTPQTSHTDASLITTTTSSIQPQPHCIPANPRCFCPVNRRCSCPLRGCQHCQHCYHGQRSLGRQVWGMHHQGKPWQVP